MGVTTIKFLLDQWRLHSALVTAMEEAQSREPRTPRPAREPRKDPPPPDDRPG